GELMPGRHSIFWRLVVLVAGFCLAMIWAADYIGKQIDHRTSYLSEDARTILEDYAAEAGAALRQGPQVLDRWLTELRRKEDSWAVVVDHNLHPQGSQRLSDDERQLLTFVRHHDWPMSRRGERLPLVSVPIGETGQQLIMRLPERMRPWRNHALLTLIAVYLLPVVLSVLFCGLLYTLLISPLDRLGRQADGLPGNHLDVLPPPVIAQRRDELGVLGRSLAYPTQRLRNAVTQQQQLLRELSHELRTPH